MTFVRIGLWRSGKRFLKRHPYSEHRKKRPSGSALPSAPPTLPLSASASLEAGRRVPPPRSLLPPSEGRDCLGETEGVPHVGSREVSPPAVGGRGGGEAPREPQFLWVRVI